MRAYTQTPRAGHAPRRLALGLALLAAVCCAAAAEARAASTCSIGFPLGAALTTVNGEKDGAEWNDASRLRSTDSCFGQLGDLDTVPKDVTVYTKRFAGFLAFYFEVQDFSNAPQAGQDCGGLICGGERIVIQFDPDLSRGAQVLANTVTPKAGDYQIVIIHKWVNTGGGAIQVESAKIYSAGLDGLCDPQPTWVEVGSMAASNVAIHTRSDTTGYGVEVRVPLSLLGTPTTNIGTALGVINDFGNTNTGSTVVPPNAAGVGFPGTLQFTDPENPVYNCRGNWAVPNEWGTGFFGDAAGDVKISRSPDWWYSNQIIAQACTSGGASYKWHQTKPCKTVVSAFVQNSTASVQSRHLLYLWAPHGTGDPPSYRFIALKKFNNIAASNMNAGPFDSPLFSPPADPAHPCLRVFVLPPNLLPAFDENFFNSNPTLTKAQMDAVMAAYAAAFGFGTQHWAQKNINQMDPNPVCPTCPVALRDPRRPDNAADMAALPAPLPDAAARAAEAWRGGLFDGGGAAEHARGAVLSGERPVLPLVHARADAGPEPQVPNPDRPPVVRSPGKHILMPREDLARFQRGNVIVQIRTFGYGRSTGPGKPVYTFIENMGGVIEVVPVEMLREREEVPFQFTVSNTDRERTVYHVVDVLLPPGAERSEVGLDTSRRVFAANEQRVMRGYVRLPRENVPPDFRRWGLSLHAGVSIPHGNFGNVYNPGPNVGFDLEYRLNRRFSLEAVYTYNRFRGETFTFLGEPFTLDGTSIHNLSLNGKVYGSTSPVRPFFNFGGGVYVFDSATARGGLNAGGGLQFDLTPTVALDSMYNFHNVFTSGPHVRYSTVQGGVRFRF
ncbi:MAG: outer membrane beta-barrel protein [Acidobacteria bacterium]|nr:outer membrane beta-barrel protein [Acidobacteriota bacterium]MCA1620640.1 outer membrane beta-barrel protein [Acidobacteriota bacterium]